MLKAKHNKRVHPKNTNNKEKLKLINSKLSIQRYINQSSHPNEQNLNLTEDNHQKSTHGDRGHIF